MSAIASHTTEPMRAEWLGTAAAHFAALSAFAGGQAGCPPANRFSEKWINDSPDGASASLAGAIALGATGHAAVAERIFGEIADEARRSGSLATLAASCGHRGVERYRRGALLDAFEDLQAALAAARGQPWETTIDDGRAYLLRVHAERGMPEAAERELYAWCAVGALPDTTFSNRLLIERGRLRLAQARFEQAASDLDAAGRRLSDERDSVLFEWRTAAAMAHLRLEHHSTALRLVCDELELTRRWGAPRQLGIATATLGLIEGGRAGIDRLHEAIEILDGSPARLEHGRTMVNLGITLRRNGQPREARTHLRGGLEIAVGCGAMALAHLADQELAATGVRRRRRTLLSGDAALTPSERRVACLAADGLSNPDIARALSITRKTVEMHLGNAYRKLQIGSRRQLVIALGLEPERAGL